MDDRELWMSPGKFVAKLLGADVAVDEYDGSFRLQHLEKLL